MSAGSLAVVLHHSTTRGADRLILLVLANFDTADGSGAPFAKLAKLARVDQRTAHAALRRLQLAGEITVHPDEGYWIDPITGAHADRYEVAVRCPPTCDGTRNHHLTPRSPRRRNRATTPPDSALTDGT